MFQLISVFSMFSDWFEFILFLVEKYVCLIINKIYVTSLSLWIMLSDSHANI